MYSRTCNNKAKIRPGPGPGYSHTASLPATSFPRLEAQMVLSEACLDAYLPSLQPLGEEDIKSLQPEADDGAENEVPIAQSQATATSKRRGRYET